MDYLRKYRKMGVLLVGLAMVTSLTYWFFWDRPLMDGVHLNPYQVDEIQIVRRDGDILQEEIINIRDKAWIRKILSEWKDSLFIKKAFPPDYAWINGEPIYVRVNDGGFAKLDAKVYPGHRGEGFTKDAIMLVNDRYHYNITSDITSLLSMELSEFLAHSDSVEVILDNWKPGVVQNGEWLTSHYLGDDWVPELKIEEIATVKTTLPDHIQFNKPSDITDLLTEGAGTYTVGTPIFEAEGHYFIRNVKEPDTWSILLPEGQDAHRLKQNREGKVLYWESYQTIRYFVVETVHGHEVYDAQDPNTNESCILAWDESKRRFHSPCASTEYNIEGQASEQGANPMNQWTSRELDGILFFTYGD